MCSHGINNVLSISCLAAVLWWVPLIDTIILPEETTNRLLSPNFSPSAKGRLSETMSKQLNNYDI